MESRGFRFRHADKSNVAQCTRRPALRRRATGSIVCKVANQHSHLGEAIADWQTYQQRPQREAHIHHSHHHHHKHVDHHHHHRSSSNHNNSLPQRNKAVGAITSNTTTTLPRPQVMDKFQQPIIPHLDGQTVDPTDVLNWLREYLLNTTRKCASAVVTAEETGASLLDLVSVLVLLEEDFRSEEQGATLVFQPVLDIRNKRALHPSSFRHQSAYNDIQVSQAQSQGQDPHNGNTSTTSVSVTSSDTSVTSASRPALVAALVSRVRWPKLQLESPAVCISTTVRLDSADVASIIAESVEQHGSTRLRVANSAEGLVAAWRAVRRARAIVRGLSGGARDLLCTVQILSAASSSPYELTAGDDHVGNGDGDVQQQQQQQQQGVMYFNLWRVR